jgi:molybdate transport system substrate-binding protein
MVEKLRGISSMATRQILVELTESYRSQTGREVAIEAAGGVDAARRVREGETFDLIILADDAMAKLEAEGLLKPGSCVGFARSAIALAAPAGAPRPDILDEAAVRAAILAAPSIGYSTGPSGAHLMRLLKQWGVEEQVSARLVQARPGIPVGALLARGEVALGFQQLSELQGVGGVDVIGLLPDAIQNVAVFTCGLPKQGDREALASDFVAYITSPEADESILRNGMKPAR